MIAFLTFALPWLALASEDATCPAHDPHCMSSAGAGKSLEAPPVIIGCWQLLERNRHEEAAVNFLLEYARAGFTTFDTADIYGRSESILGRFRRKWVEEKPDTAPVRFFTKYVTDDDSKGAADATNSASRKALGVKSLDLVQFHWWSLDKEGRNTRFFGAGTQLMRLKSQGNIQRVAACNFDTTNLRLLVDTAGVEIVANQVQYSLLDRRPEVQLMSYCKEKNIKLLVFGVVGGGLLSDSFLGVKEHDARRRLDSVSRRMYFSSLQAWSGGSWSLFQELLQTLRAIADGQGTNIAHVASVWALKRLSDLGAGGSLILGVRDARHLEEHKKILEGTTDLSELDMKKIQQVLDRGKPPSGDIWDRERGWA